MSTGVCALSFRLWLVSGQAEWARGLLGQDPGVACFPVAAIWGERAGGSRTGRSPAAAAAPQASLKRSSAIR